jgi:hypothetical protein
MEPRTDPDQSPPPLARLHHAAFAPPTRASRPGLHSAAAGAAGLPAADTGRYDPGSVSAFGVRRRPRPPDAARWITTIRFRRPVMRHPPGLDDRRDPPGAESPLGDTAAASRIVFTAEAQRRRAGSRSASASPRLCSDAARRRFPAAGPPGSRRPRRRRNVARTDRSGSAR